MLCNVLADIDFFWAHTTYISSRNNGQTDHTPIYYSKDDTHVNPIFLRIYQLQASIKHKGKVDQRP
jgi:hypothetical protein